MMYQLPEYEMWNRRIRWPWPPWGPGDPIPWLDRWQWLVDPIEEAITSKLTTEDFVALRRVRMDAQTELGNLQREYMERLNAVQQKLAAQELEIVSKRARSK
jgi:hypothetical protein